MGAHSETEDGCRFLLHVLNSKPCNRQVGPKLSSSYNVDLSTDSIRK